MLHMSTNDSEKEELANLLKQAQAPSESNNSKSKKQTKKEGYQEYEIYEDVNEQDKMEDELGW